MLFRDSLPPVHHSQSKAHVLPASVRATFLGEDRPYTLIQKQIFAPFPEGMKVTSQELSAHLRYEVKGHQNFHFCQEAIPN